MSSTTHRSLTAQSNERASRLAALKNLKRKQPPSSSTGTTSSPPASPTKSASPPDAAALHLSHRNYDPTARAPKLGFEHPPTSSLAAPTLEQRAATLTAEAERLKAEQAEEAGKPLDLWRLRPGRANEDLKRDLEGKMERVAVRTENAIARLVRRRVEEQRLKESGGEAAGLVAEGQEEKDGVGLGGGELVEGVKMREREEREEVERERERERGEGIEA